MIRQYSSMSLLERRLRLAAGLVMLCYVTPHLTNHALGLASVEAMESMRSVMNLVWRSLPGTILLYGALTTHVLLAVLALLRRTTLRMPVWEAVQIIMGLSIVPLLAGHVISTRVMSEVTGIDTTYSLVLGNLFASSRLIWQQPLALIVVWIHVCIGLHFWLRLKRGYRGFLPLSYALALLLPVLAILGYIHSGTEVTLKLADESHYHAVYAELQAVPPAVRERLKLNEILTVILFPGAICLMLLVRMLLVFLGRVRSGYRIFHANGRNFRAPGGQTLLEAIRHAGIPHASVCGGRARCTTCRVRVGDGLDNLPMPSDLEARALARIGAAPNVRLACQTRPSQTVQITPLIPAATGMENVNRPGGVHGHEQQVAILFLDLRGSTTMGEQHLPYDVVFILNQFFAEMAAGLDETAGHYAQFAGDGLMALYGLNSDPVSACRQALTGAVVLKRKLDELNRRLDWELPEPLRMGIGIHSGEAIVGTMGPPSAPNHSAIGDNVNIAARLESSTRKLECGILVSTRTTLSAGLKQDDFPVQVLDLRGREGPLAVHLIGDVDLLEQKLKALPG